MSKKLIAIFLTLVIRVVPFSNISVFAEENVAVEVESSTVDNSYNKIHFYFSNLICDNDDDIDVDLNTLNFRLVLLLSAGQTVYIRVSGFSSATNGSFVLYAEEWEE